MIGSIGPLALIISNTVKLPARTAVGVTSSALRGGIR